MVLSGEIGIVCFKWEIRLPPNNGFQRNVSWGMKCMLKRQIGGCQY